MSSLKEFDDRLRENHGDFIAGFDEAGRGPLCGPVVAAGVILPPNFDSSIINDSKKLTNKKRREMFEVIKKEAIAYHISIIDVETIDRINILEASRKGMQEALDDFVSRGVLVNCVVTDYMNLHTSLPLYKMKKGDATSLNVAAASILAKVTRDDILIELDKKYPEYGFKSHKGYGTKEHLEKMREYGIIEGVYRKSFKPVKEIILEKEKITLF